MQSSILMEPGASAASAAVGSRPSIQASTSSMEIIRLYGKQIFRIPCSFPKKERPGTMLPNNKNRLRGPGPYGLFLFLRFSLLMRAAPESHAVRSGEVFTGG